MIRALKIISILVALVLALGIMVVPTAGVVEADDPACTCGNICRFGITQVSSVSP